MLIFFVLFFKWDSIFHNANWVQLYNDAFNHMAFSKQTNRLINSELKNFVYMEFEI